MHFEDLSVGQEATARRTITEADIHAFAAVSGDRNPAHVDHIWAAAFRFKGPVAHGMLTAALVSAVLGMQLPGPGTIYLSQTLRFTGPVRPGDTITTRVEVTALEPARRLARLATTCTNQRGETVLDGEATVLVEEGP